MGEQKPVPREKHELKFRGGNSVIALLRKFGLSGSRRKEKYHQDLKKNSKLEVVSLHFRPC